MTDSTPPGGRARLSQERSRVRRDQLITAAATLFAEGGTKAVTHRSVSEAADVPLATVSYYFASIEQLVDVVFSQTLASWNETWNALQPEPGTVLTPDDVGAIFERLLSDHTSTSAAQQMQVYLATFSRPHLMDDLHAMRANVGASMISLVQATGVEDSVECVRALSVLYTGALVSITDPSDDIGSVAALLRRQVVRVLEDGLRTSS